MPDVPGPSAFSGPPETWLRGNVRPVLVAAISTLVSGGAIITALVLFAAPVWLTALVGGMLAAGGLATVALAVESARPRLARQGGMLLVRLAPWHQEAVPLGVMECFFLGSSPVGRHPATSSCGERGDEPAASSDAPSRRRGTLAIRLAERAQEYSQRSVSLPWGGWARGTIVVDGMWCEPLSPSLVRDLTGRLVAAKRETP